MKPTTSAYQLIRLSDVLEERLEEVCSLGDVKLPRSDPEDDPKLEPQDRVDSQWADLLTLSPELLGW